MIDKKIIILYCMLVTVAICWLLFGIHDNRARINTIGNQLEQIRANQQQAIDRIDTVQKGLDSSANRINASATRIITIEQRIDNSTAGLAESANIITECKSILKTIRERNESKN